MNGYRFIADSHRAEGAVRGQLTLLVEAESPEEAEALVKESLPGFDWEQWRSMYGVTVMEVEPA